MAPRDVQPEPSRDARGKRRSALAPIALLAAIAVALVLRGALSRETASLPAAADPSATDARPLESAPSAAPLPTSAPAWPPPGDGDTAPAPPPTSTADSPSPAALPRVVAGSPTGVRVPLDAPITLRFDRAPSPAGLTITTDPPAEGRLAWTDPTTATFTPARWADGKPYRVRVAGPSVQTATLEFRTLFPPPDRIEPGAGQRITFTFDDGADRPAHVTALLDLLEKERIQAIFFPIGRWAEAHPKLIERMVHDGHRVCNHTYSHQNLRLPQLTDDEVRAEITRGATDGACRLFRPPLKAFDPRVERILAELGLTLYLWDVDSRDWEGATTEDIVNLVLARAHPGAVVLFHMHAEASLEALPTILPRLRKAGYVFRDPDDAGAP